MTERLAIRQSVVCDVTFRERASSSDNRIRDYPIATGTCKGFDPLDPKGRTLPLSKAQRKLLLCNTVTMQHCDSVSMTQVTEGAELPRTDAIELQTFLSLITVARFKEADKICDFVELTAEPQLLPFAPKRE